MICLPVGSYQTINSPMEMYFFHIVPTNVLESNDLPPYFHWSTYKVQRNFVKIPKVKFKKKMKYSNNLQNQKDEKLFTYFNHSF